MFGSGNPFLANKGGYSSIFTAGKSLFETSNLGTFNLPQEAKKDSSDEEDESLKSDEKESVQSNKEFVKVFQKQVEKLKVMKGISSLDKKPSKKDNGYLSIEKQNTTATEDNKEPTHYLVFRSFMGATLFSGLINPKVSKIKELNDKECSYKVKVAVACKDPSTK